MNALQPKLVSSEVAPFYPLIHLLWLIALMLADNAREDFFGEEEEDGDKGEFGAASSDSGLKGSA
ncbi:hypothetical protein glysoja_042733 [Glycine soja]|uniref:Uncharacterized protein n=1 Tax=Glycine soja TaxID=3848 RepID=A0A0B2NQH5_GLYSO|nr:hypothetical protein glysoja_042733 [Glycine soja]